MTTMMTNCGNLVNLSCCYWRWNAYAVSGTWIYHTQYTTQIATLHIKKVQNARKQTRLVSVMIQIYI
jgi:hypothetical protein